MSEKECQFCLGENWQDDEFDGQLTYVLYKYNDTGVTNEGNACNRCLDFIMYHDNDTTTVLATLELVDTP